ncbi:MAG: DUF904 domain-containing protein [Burkholderiaceae bacterium]|nr:MAG: DUF904 domain-containing protein [Burkholderiaceae bacterium]
MTHPSLIDQITERFEQLMARHEELRQVNARLSAEVQALAQERDHLKARMTAARERIDALLDLLPGSDELPLAEPTAQPQDSKT